TARPAARTWLFVDASASGAARTRATERDWASADADLTGPFTLRTSRGPLAAGATALRTGDRPPQRDCPRGAADRVEQIELERVFEIGAASGAAKAATSAAEQIAQVAEDVLEARILAESLA